MVVVDFAVVDESGVPILAPHRLLARDEVDDGEPHRSQGDVVRLVNTLLVGSSVDQAGGRPLNESAINRSVLVSKANNATHVSLYYKQNRDIAKPSEPTRGRQRVTGSVLQVSAK